MTALPNSPESRDIASLIHPYTNLKTHLETGPMILRKGKGVWVYDDAGNGYIEGLAGLWSTSLGFDEERLVEAAARQMRELPFYHVFGSKSHHPAIELAERLLAMAPVPMSKVFFANSGSEANDSAVKLVWYFNNALGRPEKKKIISRWRGYHGVTLAAASLTGLPANHIDFDLPIRNIIHAECPHYYRDGEEGESETAFATRMAASLERQILDEGPDTIAAFIAEPVMGAGGVIVPPESYFAKIQAVLKKYDVLFIADEVICGFGRTGNMFGTQTYDLQPDMITMAKALSSSYMPISALMMNQKIFDVISANSDKVGTFGHGYTYSAHPVPAAVALETLKIYQERDIVAQVRSVMGHFQERFRQLGDHSLAGEVRCVGLIGAVEVVRDKATKEPFEAAHGVGAFTATRAQENGLILRALGDSVALCPPLIVTEPEIDAIFDRLEKSLDEAAVMAAGLD